MAVKLRESYAGLEQKVKVRTLELNEKVAELESSRKAILNIVEDLDEEKNNLQKEPLAQSSNNNHNVSMVSPALTKNQYSTTRVNRSCTPNSHIARLAQPKNKVEIKK